MSDPKARVPVLVRLTYLFPLLEATLMAVLTFLPHVYFVYGGRAHDTLSPAGLASAAWKNCTALLDGSVQRSAEAIRFSWLMVGAVILYWLLFAVCMCFFTVVSIGSCVAYRYPAATRESNLAKRWIRFFCFGRIALAVVMLLPVLLSTLPYVLNGLYASIFAYDMQVWFFVLPDPITMGLLSLIGLCLLFGTGRLQKRTHTDLFRLYRVKKKECDTNEDTV